MNDFLGDDFEDDDKLPVHEMTAEFQPGPVDIQAMVFEPQDWEEIGRKCNLSDAVQFQDADLNENKEPMVRLSLSPWFILGCLEKSPDFNPQRLPMELQPYAGRPEVDVPLRSLLAERVSTLYGPGPAVNPAEFNSVADLNNPFGSAIDWTRLARVVMRTFINSIPVQFKIFDSPNAVRWAAAYFSTAVMDRTAKTLTISRAQFERFPNPSLREWRSISENTLDLGWKVVLK